MNSNDEICGSKEVTRPHVRNSEPVHRQDAWCTIRGEFNDTPGVTIAVVFRSVRDHVERRQKNRSARVIRVEDYTKAYRTTAGRRRLVVSCRAGAGARAAGA